jgi:uncharacterized protein with NRDE domain
MCLLVLAWQVHPRYRLVVAANRDEFHERPTAPMDKWAAPDDIVAGRDLRAGGTWLAMDRKRRFGVITNFRDMQPPLPGAPSRGNLIPDYLRNPEGAQGYFRKLQPTASEYSGFNLLLMDNDSLWYASNRAEPFANSLPPGVYGLSNHFLDTPWPKLQRVRRQFDPLVRQGNEIAKSELLRILADPTQAGVNEELPETRLSPEWEQMLSSPFIRNEQYGTRCSTLVLLEHSGAVTLLERRFDPSGAIVSDTDLTLRPGEWP